MQKQRLGYSVPMKCLVVAAVLLGTACTTPNPEKSCATGACSNPGFPYCDVEGTISGEPGTCIAVSCTPGAIKTCLDDDALTCNATGDGYERVPCELGCKAAPEPHCGYIEPRYVPDVCDTPAESESFIVSNSGMFDPNLDVSCNGDISDQPGAPAICVVRYRRISVLADTVLQVIGKAGRMNPFEVGRPVAFVADEDVSIEGTLDVSAKGSVNGPGGGLVISGGQAGVVSPGIFEAPGGAGGHTVGGAGGSPTSDLSALNGGLPTADPAYLAALVGGAAAIGSGGGGGGAVMLVSCNGTVSVTGTITAGGGGGTGGLPLFDTAFPGGGGGAGGYIVLQGKRISVTGSLFANGGAGGSGTQANLMAGRNGSNGSASATTPAYGGNAANGDGIGGYGGVGVSTPGPGGRPTMTGAAAGGGGGSTGFLQTYTPDGIEPNLASATVSPPFQANGTIKTR